MRIAKAAAACAAIMARAGLFGASLLLFSEAVADGSARPFAELQAEVRP